MNEENVIFLISNSKGVPRSESFNSMVDVASPTFSMVPMAVE